MASIDVSTGMTLEYDIRGEGEPILFVMGLAGQLIDWREEFVDLFVAEGYQAIRFDNRDIGLSTQTDWQPPSQRKTIAAMATRRPLKDVGYTVEDMAADERPLLEALGIESAHVAGASMGGMITQAMAINHPSKVRSICSIMSNTGDRKNGGIAFSLIRKLGRRPAPTLDTAVEDSVTTFSAISGDHFDEEEHRKLTTESVTRSFTPAGVARQTAAIGGSPDRTARLRQVKAPALVIHGLKDPLVKPSGGIATANAIPGSRLLMFGDMGHDLPRPRWPEMADAMLDNVRTRLTGTLSPGDARATHGARPPGSGSDMPNKPSDAILADTPAGAENYSADGRLKKRFYEARLEELQEELVKLQYWVAHNGLRVLIIFEGRGSAGKGGVIKRISERTSPRIVRTEALPKPTEREQTQWYFQRYVPLLPSGGEIVLFDRSWYNRSNVEWVMGFCNQEQHQEFLRTCPEFERMLVRSGVIILKYWFSISYEEQERRFAARNEEPLKRWKLSTMDLEEHRLYTRYSMAKDTTFQHTDIKQAPWFVVPSDDKRRARLNCISHILSRIPYKDVVPDPIDIPQRVELPYIRPPMREQTFVPQVF